MYEHSNKVQIEGRRNQRKYALECRTCVDLLWAKPPEFSSFFILCLIILTSNPTLDQKRATFTKKIKIKMSMRPWHACVPAQPRFEVWNRAQMPPLWQLWWLCTRLRAARWRTLGNEAQLGLTGKDTGWHNSPSLPHPVNRALSLSIISPSTSPSGRFA